MKRSFAFFVSLLFGAGLAHAEDVASKISDWGLVGEWAADCSQPAGKGSQSRIRFLVGTSNGTTYEVNNGGGWQLSHTVLGALLKGTHIELQISSGCCDADGKGFTLGLTHFPDGAIRALYVFRRGGVYTVRDGKLVSGGDDTVRMVRCSKSTR